MIFFLENLHAAILLIDWNVQSTLIACFKLVMTVFKNSWFSASVADILFEGSFYSIFFIKSNPSEHSPLKY